MPDDFSKKYYQIIVSIVLCGIIGLVDILDADQKEAEAPSDRDKVTVITNQEGQCVVTDVAEVDEARDVVRISTWKAAVIVETRLQEHGEDKEKPGVIQSYIHGKIKVREDYAKDSALTRIEVKSVNGITFVIEKEKESGAYKLTVYPCPKDKKEEK